MNDEVWLSPMTKIEPLTYRWPASAHLIAPASLAMNLAFRAVKKLDSFVENPAIHIAASRDPAMFGGQFLELTEEDISWAANHAKELRQKAEKSISFATQLRVLNEQLQRTAKGHTLDEFVRSLPEDLAGRVELVYDVNNHARVRLIEDLLYGSVLDSRWGQEFCLQAIPDAKRPFAMGNPVPDGEQRLFLKLPFDDRGIDRLASMRTTPRSQTEVAEALGLADTSDLFRSFFTDVPPARRDPDYQGTDIRIRYFGHACVLIQTSQVSVLLDPVVAFERDSDEATLTFEDLPDFIDYVVLTHGHSDHFLPELLIQIRHKVGRVIVPCNDQGNVADPSLKLVLRSLGFADVLSVAPFEAVKTPHVEIVSLPFVGEHAGLDVAAKQCVLVRAGGKKLLFLADADGIDSALFSRLTDFIGVPDAMFIGMECRGAPLSWLYGPLLTTNLSRRDDESRRLSGADSERAWRITEAIGCKRAFVYAMGQEKWMRRLMGLAYTPDAVQILESDKFVARCEASGVSARRLHGCCELML